MTLQINPASLDIWMPDAPPTTQPGPAIETSGLTKTFGGTHAVQDLDLRVESGEIFGFLGPNGAGKTTTIRLLLDLQHPTAGTARLLGFDAHRDCLVVHRQVGYLPGELSLIGRMRVRDQLDWVARARNLPDTGHARDLADRFDLDPDRRIEELSKGNRQKVGILLAFMHQPELLILDEPTSGLDPLMKDQFEQLLRETAASGRTVFLSSHELDEVQRVADRVGLIKDGRLIRAEVVERLRAKAPRTVEISFQRPVDPSVFAIEGVRTVTATGALVTLEVTGPIGHLLQVAAPLHPVDVITHEASLDQLFLEFYRDSGSDDHAP